MFCNKARNWINLERDGQLPADKTVALEKHLDSCADCRAYREDLARMSRLIAATADEPSENFEWNLQLRLNRALRDAAADGSTPWQAPRNESASWLRGFAASAAAGLAASITFALLVLPGGGGTPVAPVTSPQRLAAIERGFDQSGKIGPAVEQPVVSRVNRSAGDLDRRGLSLFTRPGASTGGLLGQPVRLSGTAAPSGYSGLGAAHNRADLETISRLSRENSLLRAEIIRLRRVVGQEQALIDSTNSALLDRVGNEK